MQKVCGAGLQARLSVAVSSSDDCGPGLKTVLGESWWTRSGAPVTGEAVQG